MIPIKKYFGYYNSPIGLLKVICSEDSVLSVVYTDETDSIEETGETSMILEEVLLQLDQYFKGTRREFSVNVALNGTDFQNRVWNELKQIPYGTTCSYGQLAAKIGNPKAARAIGNANSKNKIWIIVPCHRVIGSDGNLTGYAGELHRKQWLLKHEGIRVEPKTNQV